MKVVELPGVPPSGDVSDYLASHNAAELQELIDAAPPWAPAAAEPEVAPADLGVLLDEIDRLLNRYVAFPSITARWAVAAWVIHAHALEGAESTPRLALLSPEKGSGNTRNLEVMDLIVPDPLHTVNLSAAALFRKVGGGRCTLLLDECDTYLGPKVAQQHEDVRALVNAGHRGGAVAYRCVVENGVRVEEFPAFAPCALAGIGDLPDTILDRSIVISMKRRAPDEILAPFRRRKATAEVGNLRERLEVWAVSAVDTSPTWNQ